MSEVNTGLNQGSYFSRRVQYLVDEHKIAASLAVQRLVRQPFQSIGAIFLMGCSLAILLFFMMAFSKLDHLKNEDHFEKQIILMPVSSSVSSFHLFQEECAQYVSTGILDSIESKRIGNASMMPQYVLHISDTARPSQFIELKNQLMNNPHIQDFLTDPLLYAKSSELFQLTYIGIVAIGLLLFAFVLMMTNYTVKLFMDRYQQEIGILYQLGASPEFIRRPYLYQGIIIGLMSVVAGLCAFTGLHVILQSHLKALSALYSVQLSQLVAPDYQNMGFVVSLVLICSFLSAYFSTHKWLVRFQALRM